MKVMIRRAAQQAASRSGIVSSNPYSNRFGAWGIVRAVYGEDHSVDVLLDAGVQLSRVPVVSKEWVLEGESYTSGARDLPPVGARVLILMPTGNFDGCVVLCSGFTVMDQGHREAFLVEGEEGVRKRVLPGKWEEVYHYATGTYEVVGPDGKSRIKIDYGMEDEGKEAPELHINWFDEVKMEVIAGERMSVSVYGDEVQIEHQKGESARVSVYDTEMEIKAGEMSIESGGDVMVKGQRVVIAGEVDIKGGSLECKGTASPTGTGCWCALPFCAFSGAPQTGNNAEGT